MILADSCQELVDLVGDSTELWRAKWCQGGLVEAVGGVGCDRMGGVHCSIQWDCVDPVCIYSIGLETRHVRDNISLDGKVRLTSING